MVGRAGPLRPLVDLLVMAALAWAARGLAAGIEGLPLAPATLLGSMAVGWLVRRLPARGPVRVSFEVPLATGMILLGVNFDRERLACVGAFAPLWILAFWLLAGGLFALGARMGRQDPRTACLLAIGMGGAGLSAVVAAARGDPRAPPDAVPLAVGTLLIAGALGFLLMPPLARAAGLDAHGLARWAGIAVPTTAEAVLVARAHSTEAFELTGAWRLLVNLLQWIPVVVYLGRFAPAARAPGRVRAALAGTVRRVPAFVWGLSLLGAFSLLGGLEEAERRALGNLANWAFLLALAGVGVSTPPASLWRLGPRRVLGAVLLWAVAAGVLLAAVAAGSGGTAGCGVRSNDAPEPGSVRSWLRTVNSG